jgi:hypothetical protein
MTQTIIKDLNPTYKQISSNLAKEIEKSKKLSAENKILRKTVSRGKQRIKEVTLSREKTRVKNVTQYAIIKQLRSKLKPKRHHYTALLIRLAVMLRVFTGCSFRSISKILTLLKDYLCLEDFTIPCANTIQNWTVKLGLNALKNLDKTYLKGDIGIIIDESILIGNSKLLMVLFVPAFGFVPVGTKPENQSSMLNFSDVRVAYMGFDTSWTAKKINEVLVEITKEQDLKIAYIVSDEAAALKCSAKLANIAHLPDISHILGTCLRKTYNKNEDYKKFFAQINSYKRKGVNQDLTYLLPPKQRSKVRFMNQKPTIIWANTLLSKYDTLKEKEKEFFKDLFLHKPLLKSMSASLEVAKFVGLCYKKQGLCSKSIQEIDNYLANVVVIDSLMQLFVNYLKEYTKNYAKTCNEIYENSSLEVEKREICALNICSDVIESMFGKYKNTISTNQLVAVSTICLELPLCHMNIEQLTAQIIPSMEGFFVADINRWKKGQNVNNQAIQRRDFFKTEQKKSNL